MKNIFVLFLALVMVLSFAACGGNDYPEIPEDDGIVDNLVIGGEEVSAKDFVIESVNKYIAGEQYAEINGRYEENFGESQPFEVTRVVDLKAYGLGQTKMDIHYLLIKVNCNWAKEENGDLFFDNNLLLVADYETGTVWSALDADESWMNDGESKEYWTYVMLNGPLCGSGYDGGALINDNVETRSEFSEEEIAEINAAIVQ